MRAQEDSEFGQQRYLGEIDQGDLIAGYPKTGRTWLRYMLANTLVRHAEVNVDVDFMNAYSIVPNDDTGLIDGQPTFQYEGIMPKIEMTHRQYDPTQHEQPNKVFLTRDPRDIMVSHWLHNKNQIKIFSSDLADFIHDPDAGIDNFMRHLESWTPHLHPSEVLTYEEMLVDPVRALKKVFARFRIEMPSSIVEAVTENSTIDRMRKKEIEKGIAGHEYDRTNPEALRMRRGKAGGFIDYLNDDDIQFIDSRVRAASSASQKLVSLTGYRPLSV